LIWFLPSDNIFSFDIPARGMILSIAFVDSANRLMRFTYSINSKLTVTSIDLLAIAETVKRTVHLYYGGNLTVKFDIIGVLCGHVVGCLPVLKSLSTSGHFISRLFQIL